MSTRRAQSGAPTRQERYCSSREYATGLKALPVARRAELVQERELREAIWFLQFRSLPPREEGIGRIGGIEKIAGELVSAVHARFAERNGIPSCSPEVWRQALHAALAGALMELCINPEAPAMFPVIAAFRRRKCWRDCPASIYSSTCASIGAAPIAEAARSAVAETEVADELGRDAGLHFRDRASGVGRRRSAHGQELGRKSVLRGSSWRSALHPYSAGNGRARAVSRGGPPHRRGRRRSDNAGQIRERVEEVLRPSRLMLVFDEAQRWPATQAAAEHPAENHLGTAVDRLVRAGRIRWAAELHEPAAQRRREDGLADLTDQRARLISAIALQTF